MAGRCNCAAGTAPGEDDSAAAFPGHPDAEVIFPGDHHPNAAGNRIIAETVLATLRRAGLVAPDDGRASAPSLAAP